MGFPGLALVLKLIAFALSSWLLVHLLAFLGIFLAFAYPLWWLFAPRKIPCLLCRVRNEGDYCPLCRKKVVKEQGTYPKSFTSAFLNGFIVLALSLTSFGVVFAESKILFKLGFPPTLKTVSFVIPPKGQYRLKELFPMKIEITGVKTAINAIQADVSFDPRILEVAEVSTKDSFANIFIQKEINNEAGYARLTGGLPNPGFFADHGIFGTVYFKGKNPGVVKVEFLPSSMVLANDGKGTNVLRDLASATYLILPEKITPEEEVEQQVLLQPGVLGETTETQMKFYEETRVLGASVEKPPTKQGFNPFRSFLTILEAVDRLILNLWHKLIGDLTLPK